MGGLLFEALLATEMLLFAQDGGCIEGIHNIGLTERARYLYIVFLFHSPAYVPGDLNTIHSILINLEAAYSSIFQQYLTVIVIFKFMQQVELSQNSERFSGPIALHEDQQTVTSQAKRGGKLYVFLFLGVVLLVVWSIHYRNSIYEVSSSPFAEEVQEYKQKELIEIPHDTQCYTQGLSFINSTHILESCGIYRRSYFHILEYEQQSKDRVVTKEVYKSKTFEDKYFLEGSVHFPPNNKIYFLTWRENIVFRYDRDTLEEVDRLTWGKDGWGLTHNHSHLIVSDGSDSIYVTDEKMGILEKIKVKDHLGKPKFKLNELEWVQEGKDQFVLANVYETSEIVKINLRTGEIVSSSEFDDLSKKEAKARHFEVLNGIAYNIKSNTYLITGKQWGSMYQMVHL